MMIYRSVLVDLQTTVGVAQWDIFGTVIQRYVDPSPVGLVFFSFFFKVLDIHLDAIILKEHNRSWKVCNHFGGVFFFIGGP